MKHNEQTAAALADLRAVAKRIGGLAKCRGLSKRKRQLALWGEAVLLSLAGGLESILLNGDPQGKAA